VKLQGGIRMTLAARARADLDLLPRGAEAEAACIEVRRAWGALSYCRFTESCTGLAQIARLGPTL
jgi:hypothetical protein